MSMPQSHLAPWFQSNSAVEPFPNLNPDGVNVRASSHIEPGTGLHIFIGYFLALIGLVAAIAGTLGFILIPFFIGLIVDYFTRKKTMALIRGSSIAVTPNQFPELYQCAATYAQRLGMKTVPEIYIVEGNTINAAAQRVAGRKVIVLLDDIVDACLRTGDARTLGFILAHEMAHHALGHTSLMRVWLASASKTLSRMDEFSCDAVAKELVADPAIAAKALTVLLSGPQLLRFVNMSELREQALRAARDKYSKQAERGLTHPLLLRRIARFV